MPVKNDRKNNSTKSTTPIQRILHLLKTFQWLIVITVFVIGLVLGYIGFYKYTNSTSGAYSPTDIFYLTIQLTALESGAVSGAVSWELEVARWLLPLVTAYTAVIAVTTLFRKQLQTIRVRFFQNHTIICGLGEKGWLLASLLIEKGQKVVLIERDPTNLRIDLCRDNGIVVIEGDATSLAVLRKAGVHKARDLVAVCGDDGENAEVAIKTRELAPERKNGAITCIIHIVNHELFKLMRELEFGTEAFPNFRLELFNIFERGARALLNLYSPLYSSSDQSQSPHILIVGMGRLGQKLIEETARRWYETCAQNQDQLSISVVDDHAKEKALLLAKNYPKLSECCDLIPHNMNLENPQFQQAEFLFNESGRSTITKIFICLSNQTWGLQSALQLRQKLLPHQPQIILRLEKDSKLAQLLHVNQDSSEFSKNIIPFRLLEHTCNPEMVLGGTHEILAQAVHEDYLKHCLTEGGKLGQRRSMVHWNELPEDLRESNRRQVDQIRLKLQAAGYTLAPLSDWEAASYQFSEAEVETMAQLEHEYWVQERKRSGWQYAPGPENSKNKTHPDIVPWNQLSEAAKEKDRQPAIGLPKMLARAGFQISKLNEN